MATNKYTKSSAAMLPTIMSSISLVSELPPDSGIRVQMQLQFSRSESARFFSGEL